MRLIPWTTLSAAIVGDDLVTAVVSRGPMGATTRRGPVLRRFLSMPADEARRALSAVDPGASARLILTIPTSWCAVRPVPIDARTWHGAKDAVLASIEQLVPVSSGEAMVGLISRRPGASAAASAQPESAGAEETGSSSSGWLVVARRPQVIAWSEALTRAAGRAPSAVLAAPMAVLGLGLQNADRAEVLDELAGRVAVRHTLSGGEIDELAGSLGLGDGASPGAVRMPGVDPDIGGTALQPHDLAVGAALCEDIGAGMFVPLEGVSRRSGNRWFAPAAAAAVAAVLFIGAGRASDWRYEKATEALLAQREDPDRKQRQKAVEDASAATLRLAALIETGVNPAVKSWRPMLPDLAAAQSAVPSSGFLYRISLDAERLELRGEAERTGDVLKNLDAEGSRFVGITRPDPISQVPQRNLEMFTVRATRKPVASNAPGAGGEKGGAQ